MSISFAFEPYAPVTAPISASALRFPVHRIYCVGRNYAEHAKEMGSDPTREPPFFFCKPADAIIADTLPVPYPPRTQNFHHEVELVLALHRGGKNLTLEAAAGCIYGYGIGIDWTRRDLQNDAKKTGRPWDTGKAFDASATLGPIHLHSVVGELGSGKIWLSVNGELRQQGDLADLIWNNTEIIAELSTLFELRQGDLIYTGTPAGVAAVVRGDRLEAGIDGLGSIQLAIC
ncbi:MAG: Fumarylpyruvate hydrolase [Pseudomonadota bacterium]|jgi:fumarylpyruvate hydrolase